MIGKQYLWIKTQGGLPMFRIRLLCLLTALACALCFRLTASAAEVECDGVYCFAGEDFPEEALAGVCITGLPQSHVGAVMLGSRTLRPGDVLAAEQLEQLTFAPVRTEMDRSVEVSYLPIFQEGVGAEATLTIAIRGKTDNAPVAEDSAGETYKNLPLEGKLKVSEPEGQKMTFAVTRQPKRGTVTISSDGSFTYTPKKNKVGVDSFIYTAADETGHVSREATVTITILKPTDAPQYTDTAGKPCRFAAEWMKHTGIFVGETVGGSACFSPEEAVTRGEFVSMLVKTLDIPLEEDFTTTHYSDEIPQWLQPYLTAAVRAGLTFGLPDGNVFGAEEVISQAEAAVMIQNALDLTAGEVEAMASDAVPDWAAEAIHSLNSNGFMLDGEENLTRSAAALALYRANLLSEDAPGMQVIRANR